MKWLILVTVVMHVNLKKVNATNTSKLDRFSDCIEENRSFREKYKKSQSVSTINYKHIMSKTAIYDYDTIEYSPFQYELRDSEINRKCHINSFVENYKEINTCVEDMHTQYSFQNEDLYNNNKLLGLRYSLNTVLNISKHHVANFCEISFKDTVTRSRIKQCLNDTHIILKHPRLNFHTNKRNIYMYTKHSDDKIFDLCKTSKFAELVSRSVLSDNDVDESELVNRHINTSVMRCYHSNQNTDRSRDHIEVPNILMPLIRNKKIAESTVLYKFMEGTNPTRDSSEEIPIALSIYNKCKNKKYNDIPLYQYYSYKSFSKCLRLIKHGSRSNIVQRESECASLVVAANLKKIVEDDLAESVNVGTIRRIEDRVKNAKIEAEAKKNEESFLYRNFGINIE